MTFVMPFFFYSQVDRSIALLKSLVIERERWESSSETFRSQMSTIVGDVLLSAAFIAYGGYFDQHVSVSPKNTKKNCHNFFLWFCLTAVLLDGELMYINYCKLYTELTIHSLLP